MLGVKFATAVAAVGNARYMVGALWLPRNNKSRMLLQFLVTEWVAKDEGRWLKACQPGSTFCIMMNDEDDECECECDGRGDSVCDVCCSSSSSFIPSPPVQKCHLLPR